MRVLRAVALAVALAAALPATAPALEVGQKAPDFTLPDTNHQNVALAQLLAAPGAKGVLLIFYRGYW